MGKRQPNTPRSRIRAALRGLWLKSRERAAAIKREKNTCERCGKKGSVAKGREVKIVCHHKHGIAGWDELIDMVYAKLLVDPKHLEVLCKPCHKEHHDAE